MHDPRDSDLNRTQFAPPTPGAAEPGKDRLPVLIVLRGVQIGRRYLLNENALVLGRRGGPADLVIPGDPLISSAHCRIERGTEAGTWSLVDLSSTNGTLVNGERIVSATLRDGDRLHLGETVLKFTFHDELEDTFYRQVDDLMNVDDLTGLPVQRVYRLRMLDALVTGRPLVVFMMDMDGLKKINDAHGHLLGARSIATVGRRLGTIIVAAGGVVSRFGGDEFSAFVPRVDREQALALGERMRAAVESEPVVFAGATVHPTLSIGLAMFPDDGSSIEALTRRADEALYRAKAAGRNRVSQ